MSVDTRCTRERSSAASIGHILVDDRTAVDGDEEISSRKIVRKQGSKIGHIGGSRDQCQAQKCRDARERKFVSRGRSRRIVGIRDHQGGNESMSELAFNANGERFEVPANVTAWRVRRMKPRGAPELVYGRDGRPLMIPIESEMEDLRDAVGQLGRYRLDPINDDGRTVEGVSPAYIQVVKPADAATGMLPQPEHEDHGDAVREAMRLNTELARSVIDRFPDMMTAAAELLRAADGAGIPARVRRELPLEEGAEDVDDELPPGFDINTLISQLVPLVMTALAGGKIKMPNLAALIDWRKAVPDAADSDEAVSSRPRASVKRHKIAATAERETVAELPPLNPETMTHFMAVQAQLSPVESALAREVAADLAPAQLRAWFDELSKLSVAEAVARVRALLNDSNKKGGAA